LFPLYRPFDRKFIMGRISPGNSIDLLTGFSLRIVTGKSLQSFNGDNIAIWTSDFCSATNGAMKKFISLAKLYAGGTKQPGSYRWHVAAGNVVRTNDYPFSR
jgi:hypothetical protein